jgi:cytochrome c-type biogenesis protein CcmE
LSRLRWVGLAAVLTACLGYLVYSATGSSAEYYQTIAETRAHPSDQNVRVLGVVQDDVVRTEGGLRVRFTTAGDGHSMPVDYRGTLPDIFKPGVQVVVEGRLGADGVFHAQALQAKCPSSFSSRSAASG